MERDQRSFLVSDRFRYLLPLFRFLYSGNDEFSEFRHRPRVAVMASRYPYHETIRNEYLGESKVIRAMTLDELGWLVQAQLEKWDEQEERKRQQKQKEAQREANQRQIANLKLEAEEKTREDQENVEGFRTILAAGLKTCPALAWDRLLDRRAFPHFDFPHPKPDVDDLRLRLLGPEPMPVVVPVPVPEDPGFLEIFLPFLRRRRLEREAYFRKAYEEEQKKARAEYVRKTREYRLGEKRVIETFNQQAREYNECLAQAKAKHQQEKRAFREAQDAHNQAVLSFRQRYEAGSPEAVERLVQMVLEASAYPEGISGEPETQLDPPSASLVINFRLPGLAAVPNIVEHKFVAARKEMKPVEMKPKDFEDFYSEVVHQIALRTIWEVFAADYARKVQAVVFNGWVRGINSKTGNAFTSCILSCEAPRQQFGEFDLNHVSPRECVRGLKGITAGPLAQLAPVKPIMEINRDDDRFIESRPVLNELRDDDNLAAMNWEDFEHLVRELFEKEFSTHGAEVRVTQASRDRGVDAIAFDPDPIRGGKFVIQAKRYNMVVPVSAVRDLYGTMIAEGAVKGILVTTSHFGRDSRDFAKDKPITLIDGANLLSLFEKHGRNLRIDLLPKGDPRRGIG